jgi:hypothetical protein
VRGRPTCQVDRLSAPVRTPAQIIDDGDPALTDHLVPTVSDDQRRRLVDADDAGAAHAPFGAPDP